MSQPIRTYKDLCEERERLQKKLTAQKQRVKDDWHDLKQEFNPVRNAIGVFGKMTHPDRSNPLLNVGLKIASDLLLKNFVLAKAGWAARLAVPFVVKNFSSHVIAEKGAGFINKVTNLFKGRKRDWAEKPDAMNDKDNKVVNTEEQNRAVNPGTGDFQETSPKEHVGTNQATTGNKQEPDRKKPGKEQRVEE